MVVFSTGCGREKRTLSAVHPLLSAVDKIENNPLKTAVIFDLYSSEISLGVDDEIELLHAAESAAANGINIRRRIAVAASPLPLPT